MWQFIDYRDCGSFRDNGHNGPANDYMLAVFLASSRDNMRTNPTRLACSADMLITLKMNHDLMHIAIMSTTPAETKYRGADVVFEAGLPAGTIRFYIGDKAVGQCSGWTA